MGLKLSVTGGAGEISSAIVENILQPVAKAAEDAMREAGDLIRERGRRNIAAAGFSERWQKGFNVIVIDPPGEDVDITLSIFHRIGYAAIFEGGGVIHGRPLLWLPIDANLPPAPGRRRWTPRLYARTVGPLASVRGGRRPLLVGRPRRRERAVPVFFGVPSVTIPDKFDLNEVIEGVMNDFESLYEKHLKL